MPDVSMKALLEAGVHFGHQTRRWNPKMKPYIFTERNGIHILDLQQTVKQLEALLKFVTQESLAGKNFLYVGTKKQAKDAVAEEATRAGMPYVNQRWLGGTLTNFKTISSRIKRLKDLEEQKNSGLWDLLSKKESSRLEKELAKLNKMLGGIKETKGIPEYMFVVDTVREQNAILEAKKLGIAVIALADSNSDPDQIDHLVAANDDAIRGVKLIASLITDAILEGRQGATEGAAEAASAAKAEELAAAEA